MINLKTKTVKLGKGNVLFKTSIGGGKLIMQNIKRVKGDSVATAPRLKTKLEFQFGTVESVDTLIVALEQVKLYHFTELAEEASEQIIIDLNYLNKVSKKATKKSKKVRK